MKNYLITVSTNFKQQDEKETLRYCTHLKINALANKFIFFDDQFSKQSELSAEDVSQAIQSGNPVFLFVKVKNHSFKIKLESNQKGDFISLYPLEPYKVKKGIDSEKEKLDLGFYVECMLELTENFAIYELIAE